MLALYMSENLFFKDLLFSSFYDEGLIEDKLYDYLCNPHKIQYFCCWCKFESSKVKNSELLTGVIVFENIDWQIVCHNYFIIFYIEKKTY